MKSLVRLTIANKMLLGYLPLALIIIIASAFALVNLSEVHLINESIVETDWALIETTDKMMDHLLAQESYGRKHVILKSIDMLDLFWQRSRDFDSSVATLRGVSELARSTLDSLVVMHAEFETLYAQEFEALRNASQTLPKEHDELIRQKLEDLSAFIQNMGTMARQNQNQKTWTTARIGQRAFRVMFVLSAIGILFGVAAALVITRNIAASIAELKAATHEISQGKWDRVPDPKNQDELGELAVAFKEMAHRLAQLEEMYLDASPLTRLPGGVAIENVLKKRLEQRIPVAFCLLDLDNFKSFNDRYGYARGNEVIKTTAKILEEAVRQHGSENDFVGHVGGDDFAIVTTPEHHDAICRDVVENFDRKIINYYDNEDRQRGHIVSKNRQGQEMVFPIMTVSIAVVANDRKMLNHIEMGEIAAELKEYVKSKQGSMYIMDRRGKSRETI